MTLERVRRAAKQPATWIVAFAAMWFVVGFLPIDKTDLDIFFWPAVQPALAGHPLQVYAVAGQQPYPNANGPVALVPLTVVGAFIRALAWSEALHPRRAVIFAVFSLFILLMAREGVIAIERLRDGRRLGLWARRATYALLALAPPIWQSVAGFGHIEQPIEVWLVLVAARWLGHGWAARAGLAFGLAILSRSAAGLLAVSLALSAWHRAPKHAARLLGATAVTGVAGLLPFFLADRPDLVHSLFTYRSSLAVGAGSIWGLTHGTALESVGQHDDVFFVAGVAIAANLWLASRPGGMTEGRMFAGMALVSASFALLTKTVWSYYFFEVFVFATVWAIGRWRPAHGIPALLLPTAAVCVLAFIAEVGSTSGLKATPVAVEGAAMFILLGAAMGWTAWTAGKGEAQTRTGNGSAGLADLDVDHQPRRV